MKLETPDRLEDILDNWCSWMQHHVMVEGFPVKSAVLSTGGTSKSFEDMCSELDSWLGEVTNTSINDLSPIYSCAIHHRYLRAVFRFKADPLAILAEAKEALREKLLVRNVYL